MVISLKSAQLDTPLGPMIAVGDETALYFLEFVQQCGINSLKRKAVIIPGKTEPTCSIEKELKLYFNGELREFKTPLVFLGSPFQMSVWEELRKIPHGETTAYSHVAAAIGRPSAFRAVAQANRRNRLAIVIPCHRVINRDGNLGGYAGGLTRKMWLIDHEKQGLL